jgi:Mg2+/citrate symporter
MRSSLRYWAPLAAGVVCLIVSKSVSPLIAYVLIVVAFALVLDGATALFARATRAGRLSDNRQ